MQALLEGISLCQPQPKLPSELIPYLGKTFCAWHIAIPLLESHVFLFPGVAPIPFSLLHLLLCIPVMHQHQSCMVDLHLADLTYECHLTWSSKGLQHTPAGGATSLYRLLCKDPAAHTRQLIL